MKHETHVSEIPDQDQNLTIILSLIKDLNDFDPTVLTMTFPADEAPSETIFDLDVPIVIRDDDIDEAEQDFIVYFEVIDSINGNLILSERKAAVCRIADDDREY